MYGRPNPRPQAIFGTYLYTINFVRNDFIAEFLERERERERERETDRQTDRQTDRERERDFVARNRCSNNQGQFVAAII